MFGTRRVRPRNNVGNHPNTQTGLSLQSSSASSKPRADANPSLAWYQKRQHLADCRLGAAPQAKQPANRGGIAGPLHVYAPVKEAERQGSSSSSSSDTSTAPSEDGQMPLLSLSTPTSGRELVPTVSSEEILRPVKQDMDILAHNLTTVVGKRHPLLMAAAQQIFGAGGKKLRPAIVLLVARATAELQGLSDIVAKHRRLAEITEMIHTASLVHDDVVDDCNTRRGKTTVNSLYGTRVAVLAGDFLFAQSSWYLANLDNLEVIKLISQVVDDILDFTQTSAQLGKPQGQDLATGNLTAPAVYALQTAAAPELQALIQRRFSEQGDTQHAIQLIKQSGGLDAARQLARQEADQALLALECLPACPSKRSLELMVDYVLDRLY
ncbi:hypothetical protein WJX73_001026 [Symbiochloris irregularis]|uniref:Prenyl transferase n=1 Tax=Symbiochloris irregularis TaxID=706552 RepID=A0AAW1PB81_9CHLO